MEKVLECGVRWKKSVLELPDEEFEKRLMMILPQLERTLEMQRIAYQSEMAISTAKSGEDAFSAKTVELYCSMKGGADIVEAQDKGIECGIRIKQFAFEMPDKIYKSYVEGCINSLKTNCMEQRKVFLQAEEAKSVELDDAMKGAEFYCSIKNFCG